MTINEYREKKRIEFDKKTKWFRESFLPTFNECLSKRITEKQAYCFINNMEKYDNYKIRIDSHGTTHYIKTDDKKIVLLESVEWNGYESKTVRYYLDIINL